MTGEQLFALLSDLPDGLIEEAAEFGQKKVPILKWAALAACCALILLGGVLLLPGFSSPKFAPNTGAAEDSLVDTCTPAEPSDRPATEASPSLNEEGKPAAGGESSLIQGLSSGFITVHWRGDDQATSIDDKAIISGLYALLEPVQGQPIEGLCGQELLVTVDLKNGVAFGLCACQTGEGVLFETIESLDDDGLSVTEMRTTNDAVDFGPELAAYVMETLQ